MIALVNGGDFRLRRTSARHRMPLRPVYGRDYVIFPLNPFKKKFPT
jgi:hypothetical protein